VSARAARAAAVAALLAGCLAACGIPTTGVVEAGEPAAGIHQQVTLYFVRAEDGALATVYRTADTHVDAELAVGMLLKGVGDAEAKMLGLASDLPPAGATVRIRGCTVTVDLGASADVVSRTAVDQIVCTVRANPDTTDPSGTGTPQVVVTAQGVPVPWRPGGVDCSTAAEPWPDKPGRPTAARAGGSVSGG
jgi:hypothetical protein